MDKSIAGVVLAGGAATRFSGTVKSKLKIDDISIIERILNVISGLFDEIIIVTNTPGEYSEIKECIKVCDEIRNAGPLGGIHSAMKTTNADAIFVFAGDMPFLDRNLIYRMINAFKLNHCDVLIPEMAGKLQPLHAIFSKRLVSRLEELLLEKMNQSVWKFIMEFNVLRFQVENSPENNRAFTNINSPADLGK
jgi:molybdopterin-guanine dinucleotide biosynthesis protein A